MVSCFVSAETGDGIENLRELLVNTATKVVLAGAVIERAVLDRRAAAVARAAANKAAAAKLALAATGAAVVETAAIVGLTAIVAYWFKSRLPANQPQPQLA
jgi:hypothetical protein